MDKKDTAQLVETLDLFTEESKHMWFGLDLKIKVTATCTCTHTHTYAVCEFEIDMCISPAKLNKKWRCFRFWVSRLLRAHMHKCTAA